MRIRVLRRHIVQGTVASGYCPIALAIKERLGSWIWVNVLWSGVRYCTNEGITHRALPRAARRFIDRFDRYKPVKPFIFTINVKKRK